MTVALRTTYEVDDHYTDIRFVLSEEARERLIDSMVEQRIEAMRAQHERRLARLDEEVQSRAFQLIGRLALSDPQRRRIRERQEWTTANGETALLMLQEVRTLGSYHLFLYDIRNDGTEPLRVGDASLRVLDPDGAETELETANTPPAPIPPGEIGRGVLVATSDQAIGRDRLRFSLFSGGETVEVKW
ncbi:hypothetical protein [Alkalilimnicola ehrlichii]|uniref:hypothetical protein n=1 Tax=Alkalilimnicola ehrlichii TaxID=351052 RepID=UPI0011C06645|nr:hypothetical protein [Alkalilimnicola ehrlichii]